MLVLTCILSMDIVLTIIDFKISDTNRGKKSLLHNGYSYRIDVAVIFLGGVQIRNVKAN